MNRPRILWSAPSLPKDAILLVNLSGRGDKDMENIMKYKSEVRSLKS